MYAFSIVIYINIFKTAVVRKRLSKPPNGYIINTKFGGFTIPRRKGTSEKLGRKAKVRKLTQELDINDMCYV